MLDLDVYMFLLWRYSFFCMNERITQESPSTFSHRKIPRLSSCTEILTTSSLYYSLSSYSSSLTVTPFATCALSVLLGVVLWLLIIDLPWCWTTSSNASRTSFSSLRDLLPLASSANWRASERVYKDSCLLDDFPSLALAAPLSSSKAAGGGGRASPLSWCGVSWLRVLNTRKYGPYVTQNVRDNLMLNWLRCGLL